MKFLTLIALGLTLAGVASVDAYDSQYEHVRRPPLPVSQSVIQPQLSVQSAARKDPQDQVPKISSQNNSSVRSQLPKYESLNIDQIMVQSHEPTEYRFEQVSYLIPEDANESPKDKPENENPAEEDSSRENVEMLVETGPNSEGAASGRDKVVISPSSRSLFRIIEEETRIIVVQE